MTDKICEHWRPPYSKHELGSGDWIETSRENSKTAPDRSTWTINMWNNMNHKHVKKCHYRSLQHDFWEPFSKHELPSGDWVQIAKRWLFCRFSFFYFGFRASGITCIWFSIEKIFLEVHSLFFCSFSFFPTCQVRVVRFYQRCSPPPPPPPHPPPPPRSPDPSGHSRTSTASSRSQWALPDLNRELQIAVGTAGPQPRLPGRSGHCRTSTASSRSQWAQPDLHRELQIPVGTAGPQPRVADRSGHCRTSTATSRSQWALPNLNGKNVRKDVR